MVADFPGDDLRLRDLMDRFQGRVYTLFLILLCLPFCQPIALPGLSTPFGFIIMLLGIRFALRQQPWLPAKLLDLRLPARLLVKIVTAGAKMLGLLEKVLRPRATSIFDFRLTHFLCGFTIAFCGALLLLPLPVPLSNLLPAFVIIIVAASFSEQDGTGLVVGGIAFLITLIFFAIIFIFGAEAFLWLTDYLGDLFSPGDETLPFDLPIEFPILPISTPAPIPPEGISPS